MIIEKPFNNKEYRITLDTEMRNHLNLEKGDTYTVELACINGENILIFRNKSKNIPEVSELTSDESRLESNNINILEDKNQLEDKPKPRIYSMKKCGFCNNEIGTCRLNVNGKFICNECKNKLIDKTIKEASRRM